MQVFINALTAANTAARAGAVFSLDLQPPQLPASAGVAVDESDGESQMSMPISRDLRQLLGIVVSRESRQVAFHAGDTTAIEDANDLLIRRMARVGRWLDLPELRQGLQDRGLTVADVQAQLQRVAQQVFDMLSRRAALGEIVFPLVLTADALFRETLRTATPSLWLVTATAPENQVTSGLATPSSGPTAAAPLPEPGVDPARRNAALNALAGFRANFLAVLPQLRLRRLHETWRFANGYVEFLDRDQCAASFPCASSPTGGTNGTRCAASYPEGGQRGVNVVQAFIRGMPVVVARPEGAGFVKICVDGLHWKDTGFYTDTVVETAKAEVWKEVLAAGDVIYRHTLETGLW